MLQGSHTTDIITNFQTYVDDASELSAAQELDLANKKYQEICDEQPWMFLRKPSIGTATTGVDSYGNAQVTISLPSDFKAMAQNNLSTDNTVSTDNAMQGVVVFLGCQSGVYTPYQIVNYSDRRQFINTSGYAWIDPTLSKIVFAQVPTITDLTYEFDYTMLPPDLTAAAGSPYSDPIFPVRFWDIIYHLMASDDQIIQIFDPAHSYMAENKQNAADIMLRLKYWDAQSYFN